MQIKHILLALLCLLGWRSACAQLPELRGKVVSVSASEATSLTTGQWFVMTSRGRRTHVYETPTGGLNMSAANLNTELASEVCGHLVRFVSAGTANTYYLQTGYGHYFDELIDGKGKGGGNNHGAGSEAKVVYTSAVIAATPGHFSFVDANGVVMDANAGGGTLAGWGTTRPATTGGNNDWALYAVTLTNDDSGNVTIVPDAADGFTLTSGSRYYIRNNGCRKYLTLQTSYTESAVNNATPLADAPAPFTLTQSGSTWSMKSGDAYVGISSSLGWNTKNFATAQNVWTFEPAEAPGVYYIKSEKGYLKYDGSNNFAYTDGKEKADASRWTLTAAPDYVAQLTAGKYYRFRNYMDETRFVTSANGAIYAYPGSDEKYDQIWQATKSGDNWLLMCVLDGQYVRDSRKAEAYATGAKGSAMVFTAKGTADDGRPYFMIRPANNATGYFNNSKSAQSFQVVPWHDVADNSSWWFVEQTPLTPSDVAAIERLRTERNLTATILDNVDTYASVLSTYFADNACTQLNEAHATKSASALRAELQDRLPADLVEMVVNVRNDRWDADATKSRYIKKFRIAGYEAYSDPGEWKKITNVGPFGRLSNPTGVTVQKDQLLYVMVENTPKDADAQLQLLIAKDTDSSASQTVPLHAGLNIVKAEYAGEAFVGYNITNTARRYDEYAPITVHIEGGEASGCWDMHRGMTNADWQYLCQNMFTSRFLHVKGESTVLCVLTDNVRGAANPEGIMKVWDFIFDTEERLVGHDGQWDGRYRPVINPRHSYSGNPNWGGAHGTNHPNISRDYLFNFEKMVNDVGHLWEIYHEEAHAHQYPINMAATTESSNNGYAQMTNYEFGSYNSRNKGIEALVTFKNNGWGWVDILRAGEGCSRNEGFAYYGDALWLQSHLFYQLYLYFHVQGHKPDFWPRVADWMRSHGGISYGYSAADPGYYYNDYLKFAEACAEVSQTDLYEFFDTWGFFAYCDEVKVGNDYVKPDAQWFKENDRPDLGVRFVGDYGRYYLRMPIRGNTDDEARLAALKAKMQAMPKKAPGIMFIDDHIAPQLVSDTCFISRSDIYPSRFGTPVKDYGVTPGTSGDFGMFTDFRPDNGGSGIRFTQSGTGSTTGAVSGTGVVGVKVYDENGHILRIYNTKTFTLDSAVASKVKSGEYKLVVCLGDDTQLPLNSRDFDLNLDGSHTIADVSLLVKALKVTTNTYSTGHLPTLYNRVLGK